MTEINKYIKKLVKSESLSKEDTMRAVQIISLGGATPAQVSAFFTAYKMKGFDAVELAGASECVRLKNKPLEYTQKSIYMYLKPEHLELWFPAALLCSSINIPVYICTQRSDNMNIIQHLGLALDLDRETATESLKYCKMCVSFPINNQIQRNIHSTLEELEFDNFFDYALALAYPVEPLGLIFEAEHKFLEIYEDALRISNIPSALIMTEEDDVMLINGDMKSIKGKLDLSNHESKESTIERMSQIRGVCSGIDTKHKTDVLTRAAIILILAKAAHDFKSAYELAVDAFNQGKAGALIEKLALLTNNLEDEEVSA